MSVFIPRLDDSGMANNPYWYSDNPFYQAGYGLPNCTCYAWGRWYEITGGAPTLCLQDGEYWYDYPDGHARGMTPKLGSIICFANGPYSGRGHVAVVEEISSEGLITFSNSAYGGEYFYLRSGFASDNYGYEPEYEFQGFIYLDDQPDPPTPTPTKRKGMPLYFYLRQF